VARPKPGPAFSFIALIVRPLMVLLCKRDWRGQENMPKEGGVVVVLNHCSYFDPLSIGHYLVAGTHRTPRFLAKAGVFKQPTLGRLFKAAGQIPVYRESRDAALAFRDAVAAVERGEVIVVYPEGTRTQDPDLWPMEGKTGAARIALRTGAPVLPIGQWGAQDVWGPHMKKPKFFPRKTLRITAGEPMDLKALFGPAATKDALEQSTELIMDRITELVAGIRGEQPPAVRYVPKPKPVAKPSTADSNPVTSTDPAAAPASAAATEPAAASSTAATAATDVESPAAADQS
jgi:1-acyl-sn-glycerol-3-phosphate acyltransferase